MRYLTVKEVGEKWGITARMVTYYCVAGRIERAEKKGNLWLVPIDAEKPRDIRLKATVRNRQNEDDMT
ncbi:MAG: DNA-binding protein [Ethanoligenens sp.]